MTEVATFERAVRHLHAEKDATYGPSWKRRGELISVLANIARKVDRLEHVAAGAPGTRDESVVDTAVDLLVYTLKYQTYLADHDSKVAADLFPGAPPPFSDGCGGFDALLDALDLSVLDDGRSPPDLATVSTRVVAAFNELERCFAEPSAAAPAGERLKRAITLAAVATEVVAAIRHETRTLYRDFIRPWGAT